MVNDDAGVDLADDETLDDRTLATDEAEDEDAESRRGRIRLVGVPRSLLVWAAMAACSASADGVRLSISICWAVAWASDSTSR